MSGRVNYRVDGNIATIELDHPGRRNAVTLGMLHGIAEGVRRAERSEAVRVIVITGAGGHFSAGADLTRFDEIEGSPDHGDGVGALSRAAKPTIALVDGACIGGGVLIALACDLRYASARAQFSLPPSRLGFLLPLSVTKRIVDVVGQSSARDLLFSARAIDTAEAGRIRLVDEVFATEEFAASTRQRIEAIAGNCPRSVVRAKAIIDMIVSGQRVDTAETHGWVQDALHSADLREGKAAFMEKRLPRFAD